MPPDGKKTDIDRQALCQQRSNAEFWPLFFAETAFERRPARNLCSSCDVRRECLLWALEHKEIWGVWGGCDESELRRALWVNANGQPTSRNRYPHCPFCKARPSKLYVVGTCELATRKRVERVECAECAFTWKAASSVTAIKAYWRENARVIRARVARGRIPAQRSGGTITLPGVAVAEPDSLFALAASAAPR